MAPQAVPAVRSLARPRAGAPAAADPATPARAALGPAGVGLAALLGLALCPSPAAAQAPSDPAPAVRVEARLASASVPAGVPVELTLTATLDGADPGGPLASPDLSVLEPDFRLLGRRMERSVSVLNGRRREQTRLHLTLLPQRGGTIEVPAIPVGERRTAPLTLTVAGDPDTASGAPNGAGPGTPESAAPFAPGPWGAPPPWAETRGAPWGEPWLEPGGPPFGAFPQPWGGGTDRAAEARPETPPAAGTAGDTGEPPLYPYPDLRYDRLLQGGTEAGAAGPGSAVPAPSGQAGTGTNPWFWSSLALAAALGWVLLGRRQTAGSGQPPGPREGAGGPPAGPGRRPARPGGGWLRARGGTVGKPETAPPPPAPAAPPPDPLTAARERVREAYARGDGAEAREALLAWGRLRWPADPPNNLARLAQRCPPALRERITALEKAFFSPEPILWDREPVADLLEEAPPATTAERGKSPA